MSEIIIISECHYMTILLASQLIFNFKQEYLFSKYFYIFFDKSNFNN